MKRRDFLINAGLTGIAVPALGRAAIPCPPPRVSVAGGQSITTACAAGDAMSDWLARVSGAGVVWYNGFQSKAEVDLYRWAAAVNGNDPNASATDASKMAWNATGGPGSTFPYLSITRPAGAAEVDTVWWRPLSPFTGASNGKGVDDPAAGGAVTQRTWAPQGNVNELVQWPYGWYSQNPALSPDGVDFYIQIRVKMDPNASAAGMNSPCKLIEHGICHNTLTNQNLVTWLNGSYTDPTKNYHLIYVDGATYNASSGTYVAFQDADYSDPRNTLSPYSQQVGGGTWNPPAFCNVSTQPNNCWAYSFGWDTLLYHITAGPLGPNSGAPY